MSEDDNTGPPRASGRDRSYTGAEQDGSGSDTVYRRKDPGGRVKGSLFALVIGVILLPLAFGLLYWNEGRAVNAARALDRGAHAVAEAEADTVDPSHNNRLVHLSGMLRPVAPARDPSFNVSGDGLLRLTRAVEMYQWKETSQSHGRGTDTTYTYALIWSEQPIDSSHFKVPEGHRNPPMPGASATFEAEDTRLNAFRIDTALVAKLTAFTPFHVTTPPAHGFRAVGDGFYRGRDPDQPVLGDTRIHFSAVPARIVSIVAMQSGNMLTPWRDPNGHTIALIEPGVLTAAAMFDDARASEATLTWVLRVAGFLAMLLGFLCVTRPLMAVLAAVPFLEALAGARLFMAVALAAPLTLVTIGLAWIAHRPLIGGGILALAAAAWAVLPRRDARLSEKPSGKGR